MTEIDSAAFEAGVSPCNFTAGRIDSADESDAAHFSDALGRIYITAQALLLSARPQAGHTQPALTLVVEDSADGSSWATVATFDFAASDQQSAAVDSPRAYLRASWADVAGTWAVDVAVKSIATPASGGGSMPVLKSATVTVTSAQLKDLSANPIDLVAAPDGGKSLVCHALYLRHNVGTTPYTTTDIAVDIETGLIEFILDAQLFGFPFGPTSDVVAWITGSKDASTNTIAGANYDTPIQLVNFGSDLADGDGTLTVVTYYSEIPAP